MTHLEKIETQAIDFIRAASKQHEYVVSYSGGKDSEIVLHLFRKAGVKFSLIYRSTTIDPPHTIAYVLSKGATILRPKRSFFQLIQKKGLPSFARRFCCSELKEGYIAPYLALGIRRDESLKRSERYEEPEACRIYTKKKNTSQLLPILFWSENDVHDYIIADEIQCHPIYYDEYGRFCSNRRLGCLGCPLPWNRSRDDFERYPLLVRQWCRNLAIYRSTHPNSKAVKDYQNEFDQFANNLFYRTKEDFYAATYELFPIDWKEKLQDIFHVNLDY